MFSGSYSGYTASSCSQCKAGTYASISGSSTCSDCASGLWSLGNSSSCEQAYKGYYLTSTNPVESKICPSNAECVGEYQTPVPDTDYWVDRRSISYAAELYKCSRQTCKGAKNPYDTCWSYSSYGNATMKCDSSDMLCSYGATGPLCGACIDDYSFSPTTQSCQSCDVNYTDLFVVILVAIAFISFLCVYWVRASPWLLQRCSLLRFNSLETGSVKVVLVTAQIVTSISWNVNIEVNHSSVVCFCNAPLCISVYLSISIF